MDPIRQALERLLAAQDKPTARTFVQDAKDKLASDAATLPVLFPQLPRRVGRAPLAASTATLGPGRGTVDLAAWRACDAAAYVLLTHGAPVPANGLLDLFHHGDLEEKAMILRALPALPGSSADRETTPALFGEAQRTNNATHFEDLALDSDFIARSVRDGALARDEARRLVLKAAFLDMDLQRIFDWPSLADGELTRMIQDLATEREAATRKVWYDTNRLIGHAPIEGTRGRLLGGLEHGDDAHRRAACEGLAVLPDRVDLAPYAAERLDREPRADIRDLLKPLAGATR